MPDDVGDLSKFKRGMSGVLVGTYGRFSLGLETHTLAQIGYGMDARTVPTAALQLMGTCPPIYLAERTITGIMRRPDLYSVRHSDPAIKAATEAWLWPLLPRLTASAARAFAYGTVADVLDWQRKTLQIEVPTGGATETGVKMRKRSLVRHTHFGAVHEVHPDETLLDLDDAGEVVRVHAAGQPYNVDRTVVWCWDPEFGEWAGQGARRRAWRDYCEWLILTVLRDKYLERSVDAPRIVWVPDGETTLEDGTKVKNAKYAVDLLDDLRGGGVAGFPSARYGQSEAKKYEVQQLELADRHEVWEVSLNRHEANMFLAYLVAPQVSGAEEAGSGAGKTLDSARKDSVEGIALFAAQGLTRLVHLVHAKNHDPEKVPPPDIEVNDVGKADAKKVMQEVLRLANASSRGEVAMRTNMPVLLDNLGIPLRAPPADWKVGEAPDAPEVGRPDDKTGGREERREDAETTDGEEDTGGEDQVREEERDARAAAAAEQIAALHAEGLRAHVVSQVAASRAAMDASKAELAAAASSLAQLTKQVEARSASAEKEIATANERALTLAAASHAANLDALRSEVRTVQVAQAGTKSALLALQAVPPAQPSPVVIENHVHVPEQPAPDVHVTNEVNVPAERTLKITRNFEGKISGGEITEGVAE